MSTSKHYARTLRACYRAFFSQAIIVNLAPLLFIIFQERFAVTFERLGLLILVNFVTQLIVDILCVKWADRIGHRPLIVAAHVFCTAGLIALSVLPQVLPAPYPGLLAATVIYGIGGGLLEVMTNPIVDAIPADSRTGSMSLLHSFYCWGHVAVVVLTTSALALLGGGLWWLIPLLWAMVPAHNTFAFLRTPLPPALPEHEKMPLKKLLGSKLFFLAFFLMICSGAAEQAMCQWASLFAEKGLGVTKLLGDLLGPCLFALLMGAGRTLFAAMGNRLRLPRALAGCALLCVACYLTTALVNNPFVALIGCAVTGFSVSLMWPGMLSLGSRTFPGAGTALFSLMAVGGDIGCAIGPWVTGLVADASQTGLKAGLLAGVVFPALLAVGVLGLQRMRKKA
ncbi:MAG: MFS transporter [Oscillospiraceae bacterium]|jgi:fucose permease|nr:MFS transporter [Oscillospiraceae bacterium]